MADTEPAPVESSSAPLTVRLELVSFGWTFGPGRREGGRQATSGGSRGGVGALWSAALNLRRFANPPASMRRRGLTGLDRELQAAVWAAPKAEVLYAKVRDDVLELVTKRLRALLAGQTSDHQQGEDERNGSEDEDDSEEESEEENEDEDSDDECEEDEEEEDDEEEDGSNSRLVKITIGLGCEKGKHRSVAVVERMMREERLRTITINGNSVDVEVTAHHRDIDKSGKDAQRGFKGRQRAEARQRKRGGNDGEDW